MYYLLDNYVLSSSDYVLSTSDYALSTRTLYAIY